MDKIKQEFERLKNLPNKEVVIPQEEIIKEQEKRKIIDKINELEKKLKAYDYIGVKIATGRGTIEEYKNQIAEMTDWANQINSLRNCLKTLD